MITVQLDWKPNAQFAGLLVADHGQSFARRGVDVEILGWEPHTDPVEHLAMPGRIAVSEDNLAIRSAAAGNDVLLLGAMLQFSPLAWMVRADSPISGFADFARRTIGVHLDGVTALDFALRSAGLTMDDVDVVDVPYDKTAQLLNGDLDVCQCNGLVEPIEVRAEGGEIRVVWARDVGYSVHSQVLSTSRATYRASTGEVEGFLDALWDGWRAAYRDPVGTASMIVERHLPESTPEVQYQILVAQRPWVLGSDGSGPHLGVIDPDRLQGSIDLLANGGVIAHPLDAASLLR